MNLNYDEIIKAADTYYAEAALKRMGISKEDTAYMAPEQLPRIQSEQLKCFARALIEAINGPQ